MALLVGLNVVQLVGLLSMGGGLLYLHGVVRDLCIQVDKLATQDQIQAALVQHDSLRRQGVKRQQPGLRIGAVNTGGGDTAIGGNVDDQRGRP